MDPRGATGPPLGFPRAVVPAGLVPLLVSINHVDDRPTPVAGSLFAGEVRRIREALAELPPSQGRDLVLDRLARSRFVVATQLSMSALDDDDLWEAVAALLDYFVENSGAIVHIEGNGFYQADKLILETSRF